MAEVVFVIVTVYLVLGVLFVVPFLLKGLTKVDTSAHGGTIGFKLILIPGVIVFWPVLLNKWMKNRNQGDTKAQRNTE